MAIGNLTFFPLPNPIAILHPFCSHCRPAGWPLPLDPHPAKREGYFEHSEVVTVAAG